MYATQPPPARPVAADPAQRLKALGRTRIDAHQLLSIAWLPQRVSWTARITEFQWNSHLVRIKQLHGPFKRFRHRHGIAEEMRDGAEGTLVADTVEFVCPEECWGDWPAGGCGSSWNGRSIFARSGCPKFLAIATRQAAQRA